MSKITSRKCKLLRVGTWDTMEVMIMWDRDVCLRLGTHETSIRVQSGSSQHTDITVTICDAHLRQHEQMWFRVVSLSSLPSCSFPKVIPLSQGLSAQIYTDVDRSWRWPSTDMEWQLKPVQSSFQRVRQQIEEIPPGMEETSWTISWVFKVLGPHC